MWVLIDVLIAIYLAGWPWTLLLLMGCIAVLIFARLLETTTK